MKTVTAFFKKLTIQKLALTALAPLLTIFMGIQSALAGLGILILLDLLTGIRKSLKQKGVTLNPLRIEFWRSVKSYGMRQTWRKTVEYVVGIIAFAVLEGFFLKEYSINVLGSHKITELATITIALIELYSVFENLEAVSGNNLLKKLLDFIIPDKIRKAFKSE